MTILLDQHETAAASQPDAERVLFIRAAMNAATGMGVPERLLTGMTLLEAEKAFRYVGVATAGALAGALGGYLIGYLVYAAVGRMLFEMYGQAVLFAQVQDFYRGFGLVVVAAGGFSPLPFSFVTVLSGFLSLPLWQFVLGTAVARGARFTLVAWLLWRSGPRYKEWLERNLYGLTMALAMALMMVAVLVKYVWSRFDMGAGL